MKRFFAITLACGLSLSLAGCGDVAQEEQSTVDQSIVGGVPADDPAYNAVGALVEVMGGFAYPFCTGTLVHPEVVVTAKHCLMLTRPDATVFFAIGPNAFAPERVVPVVGRKWERTVHEGIMALGSDVALVILGTPVNDIQPAKLGSSLNMAQLGGDYTAIGYGLQEWDWIDPAPPFGTRHMGTMKLAGIGPMNYWPVLYRDDYDTYLQDYLGEAPWYTPEMALADWQNVKLAKKQDAVFERAPVNVNSGDSGGPMLRKVGNHWTTYGVTSGIMFLGGDTDWSVVQDFAVYSAFSPEAMQFVKSAPVCKEVTQEGICRGTELARCQVEPAEVVTTQCAETCVLAPQGAQCADACAADTDCNAIAAGGTCEAGTCTWSPEQRCTAEPGDFACLLCCLGQATVPWNYPACLETCFGIPQMPASAAKIRLPSFPSVTVPAL